VSACGEIGICLRTLKRWRKELIGDGGGHDLRKGSHRLVSHKLSEEERQRILLTGNQAEYASLPPGQIVPAIATDLQSGACLKERISQGRKQPLILHADNGNAMRAATLESRLEELSVLRSFSRPRVSNDNPYSESLFRTVKYRHDYSRKPYSAKE
jgi:transposase InsO family protein